MSSTRVSRALVVAATAALGLASPPDALAHGGRFVPPPPIGPPTGVPPVGGPPGVPFPPPAGTPTPSPTSGGIPPPTTPSTPGNPPGSPSVTGGGRSLPNGGASPTSGRASMASGWRAWWDANGDAMRTRRLSSRSGTGSVFRAADPTSGNRTDADRPTRRAVERDVLPTLRWALGEGALRDGDALAASAIALGKTTNAPDDVATILALAERRSAPALAREGAAIALGLLRRSGADDAFDGKTLDAVREALFGVVDDDQTPTRVRAFAALAVGLLGDQPCDPADAFARGGRLAVRGLWTRLDADWPSDDMPVALLVALSMQPREGVPSAVLEGLREACLKGRLGRRSVGFLTRAHAALALARLGDGESTGLFLGIARARRHDVVLRRSCVTALSVLADRLDPSLRALAAQGLADVARSGDADTAGLALAGVGRLLQADFAAGACGVADAGAADALLQALDRGSAAVRPFAALSLAIASRTVGKSADVPAFVALREKVLPALRDLAADDGESPDARGAFCIALGLLEDERGVATLVKTAARRGGNPTLRADACAALGLAGAATPEALAALRGALEARTSEDVRREAARSLGLLGDVSSVPLLLREITSGAPDHVLARAAIALGELRDVSAVPTLSTLARDASTTDAARAVALAALGLVGDLEPRPSLSRLGVDSNYLARTDALDEALSLL